VRLAVSQGISSLPPETEKPESLRHWVVKEARELLSQLRRSVNGLNAEPINPAVVSDGAGTYSVLWTSGEMPQNAVWTIVADISGDSNVLLKAASYQMRGVFGSVTGTVSQLMPTAYDHIYETAAACDVRFTVDTANRVITVEACDDGVGLEMFWTGTVYTPAETVLE
jgi:hypothetical protein